MPTDLHGRKQWTKPSDFPPNIVLATDNSSTSAVLARHPDVSPSYEEYLLLVQARNRALRRLQEKNARDRDLMRKEYGFTVYVNGANNKPQSAALAADNGKTVRRPRTSKFITGQGRQAVASSAVDIEAENLRARTAPEKRRRWNVASIDLKTTDGTKIRVSRPKKVITGEYSDDFEVVDSSEGETTESDASDSENVTEKSSSLSGDEIAEELVGASQDRAKNKNSDNYSSVASSYNGRRSKDHNINQMEKVTLRLSDVHALRHSLETNMSIRESLAKSHGDTAGGTETDTRLSLAANVIDEEEEDDDDVIDEKLKNLKLINKSSNVNNSTASKQSLQFTPNDVIVLEFSPPSAGSKLETRVSPSIGGGGAGGGSRTPREERHRRAAGQPSVEDVRVQKSRELMLRPENGESRAAESPRSSAISVSRSTNSLAEQHGATRSSLTHSRSSRSSMKTSRSAEHLRDDGLEESVHTAIVPLLADGSSACVDGAGNVDSIVEKVLRLDAKGQRHLLNILAQIEDASDTAVNNHNDVQSLHVRKSVKTETSSSFSPHPHNSKSNFRASVPEWLSSQQHLTKLVTIEILSNWGNANRLGLTEIQLFDSADQKLNIRPDDLRFEGVVNVKGDSSALVNGKVKTTKEKNMWSCEFAASRNPILIHIISPESVKATKLKLWNYNRSVAETNAGARMVRVRVEDVVVWEGEVAKGSGNQIFDYGDIISLCGVKNDEGNKDTVPSLKLYPVHSETEIRRSRKNIAAPTTSSLAISTLNKNGLEKTDDSEFARFPKPLESIECKITELQKTSANERSKSEAVIGPRVNVVDDDRSLRLSRDGANQSLSPSRVSEDEENVPMFLKIQKLTQKPQSTLQQPRDLPSWLHTDSCSIQEPFVPPVDNHVDDDILGVGGVGGVGRGGVGARNKGHRLITETYLPTVLDEALDNKKLKSIKSKPTVAGSTDLVIDLEDGVTEDGERALTPMQVIERRHKMTLEESWSSLDLFNRSQKGRISIDCERDNFEASIFGGIRAGIGGGEGDRDVEGVRDEGILGVVREEGVVDDVFIIPELPCGKQLVIDILTTWGDHHYVGLNGLEIFTDAGTLAPVTRITADPSDINILPEYTGDPRVVENLIDGVNRTRDDTHMWLAPFTAGQRHCVTMTLATAARIAVMRIWNYNKSRIHSSRGARDVEIRLDGTLVFRGEIARACGGTVGGPEAFGDTILFTTDEDILESVSRNDDAFEADILDDEDEEEDVKALGRPQTADRDEPRPLTTAAHIRAQGDMGGPQGPVAPRSITGVRNEVDLTDVRYPGHSSSDLIGDTGGEGKAFIMGRCLLLNFMATWGDAHYLGLTGLEVVDASGQAIPLHVSQLDANPRDLHVLPGYESDDRTLDKLVDGVNVTTIDQHMWLAPFTDGEKHEVRIDLGSVYPVAALRFWNYNKSPEDTYRGARTVHVELDGKRCSPPEGFLVRKGPGNCYFDFAQELSLVRHRTKEGSGKQGGRGGGGVVVGRSGGVKRGALAALHEQASQEYEVVQTPCGFIYQLQLLSSWGDPYYVGLNGLEMYDSSGDRIPLTDHSICAYPDSVNALARAAGATESDDVRTPDKLVDGVNDTFDGRHMWLAPIIPGVLNRVYILFDNPVEISMLKIWNYAKTPSRGVRDFALLVDDLLVYNGTMEAVQAHASILPACNTPQRCHTVLFSAVAGDVREWRNVGGAGRRGDGEEEEAVEEQEVQLMNDRKVWEEDHRKGGDGSSRGRSDRRLPVADQALRPGTSVPARGRTCRR